MTEQSINKSAFYISLTIILVALFWSIENITIQFIKSSNQPEIIQQEVSQEQLLQQQFQQMFRFGVPQPPGQEENTPKKPEYRL
jgi:hypothetical protein